MKTQVFIMSLLLSVSSAKALVLDFNDIETVAGSGADAFGDTYSSDGFSIIGDGYFPSDFYIFQEHSRNWTGSAGLTLFDVGAKISLTNDANSLFEVTSIDLSRGDSNTGMIPVQFFGFKADGSTVSQTHWITNTVQGINNIFHFDGFTDLISLNWEQGAEWHQFDNIQIQSVPEPETMYLFISCLGLISLKYGSNKLFKPKPSGTVY